PPVHLGDGALDGAVHALGVRRRRLHGVRRRARARAAGPARARLRAVHHRVQLAPAHRPRATHHDDLRLRAPGEDRARVDDRVLHRLLQHLPGRARCRRRPDPLGALLRRLGAAGHAHGHRALGLVLVLGLVVAAAARFLGRPGSRASILVSVVASWLGAWILWSFAGGLLVRGGVLATYHGALFAPVALFGALVHYRVYVRAGRVEGLAVFVGGQPAWLAVVLFQNGALVDL